MQRPILNPMLVDPEARPQPRMSLKWMAVRKWMSRAGRLAWKIAAYRPLRSRRLQVKIEDGHPASRVVRGLLYRLAFVPLLAAMLAVAVVYFATHPQTIATALDPTAARLYYDPVTLLSDDGVRLDGWLVPVVDARDVLAQKEQSLRMRRPAVVLLHDHGRSRDQMLPLIRPLHDAGFVVLAVGLRGHGSSGAVGATYGLREAADAAAAVRLLRGRPYVNATKISLVGVGSGANAALIAAHADQHIAAVVALRPVQSGAELLQRRLGPRQPWLAFLNPLCKWTFELAYRADLEDLNLARYAKLIDSGRTLVVRDGSGSEIDEYDTQRVTEFLATLPLH